MFRQFATMAIRRAIARQGFRSFVTNPPRPLRIVSRFRALLVTEDGFCRIVDIQNVLMVEKLVEDILLMPRKPCVQLLFVGVFELAAHAVLADDPPEPRQRRKHRVVAQPVDVDMPREAADYRKNCRAYNIANRRRIWACIVKRRILNEPVEKPARLQIGHKVGEPAPLRDLRFAVPAHV
jgi:hypothetical protein